MFTTLSAMVVAVMFTLPNASVFAATYSQELQDAYDWAYSKGVTTMSPIDNANMYGAITRAEMAKMLSVYATKVLGMEANTAAACTFSDIDSVKGDLHEYIIESCQLGIMGQGITAFRPYDTISRAEFGTALSRVLWGSQYENPTTPYYAKHLDALKSAGIMNQIANAESTKEIRGYVMLMLMRSEGGAAAVDCDDPMTVIACTTNTDACPAACREAEDNTPTVVKAGDLAVTAKAAEGRKALVSLSGAVSDLDTLTFKTSEEVTITKVVLERYGYSSEADVDAVWLEDQDGNVIADEKSLSKDKVTLSIKKDYRTVDGTYTATVVARLTGNNVGGTIGFKVVDADSSAKNLNLDDYTPYTYDMVTYAGNSVTVELKWTQDKNYNYVEGESYEVARLKVRAGSSIIYVKGFTLTNGSGLDVADFLDKLTVKADGKDVEGLKYSVNKDDQLVISFDELSIDMNKSILFVISASFADFDDYGKTVAYYLASDSDINAVEKKTGARLTVDRTAANKAHAIRHTFNGGKIKLANTKLGKLTASQGSEDVVIAEGTITVSEPISKLSFDLTATSGADAIAALRMFVNGEEYEAKKSNNTFSFSKVEIEKSGKVQFKIDIEDPATTLTGTIKFSGNFDRAKFDWSIYDNSREDVHTGDVSGSISFSEVTIEAATATLKNSLTKDVEFLTEETDTKVVFDGTYTAKKANVTLNKFYMSGATSVANTTIAYHLYVDGEEVAYTESYGSNNEEIFDDVEVKAGESVKVRVEAEVEASANAGKVENVYVVLGGVDAQDQPVKDAKARVMVMNIKEAGSAKIEAAAAKNTVLRAANNSLLAEFVVKPANDDEGLKLNDITFTLTRSGTGVTATYADKIEVLFDGAEEEATSGLTYEPLINLPKNGVKVQINLIDKDSWEYVLTVKELNGKKQTRTFAKRFEEALVYITKQESKWDETVFTLGVDADSDTVVSNVVLYAGTTTGGVNGEFSEGEEIPFLNNSNTAQYIDRITYDYELSSWATGSVNILKSTYSDYFKVNGEYAKVSKAD